jgi:hypothetical protein
MLYTHGLLRHYHASGSESAQLQPTLAAVDFGSWTGRQQRRDSSWRDQQHQGSNLLTSSGLAGVEAADMQQPDSSGFVQSSSIASSATGASSGVWSVRGGGLMSRGGQVLHQPMALHAVPTELAACSSGEVFAGTLQGDVICIH